MGINKSQETLMKFLNEQLKQLTPKEMEGLEQLIKKYLEKLSISKTKVAEELENTFHVEKTVLFTYKNADGKVSERIVDVKQIMHHDKGWKVKGICHTRLTMRTFNAERIVDDRITDVETGVQDTLKGTFSLP